MTNSHLYPDIETERFCPFHGAPVRLAACPIVATNMDVNNDSLDPIGPVSALGDSKPRPESNLYVTSTIDGQQRLLLVEAPLLPPIERKFLRRRLVPRLPSPAELCGGTESRPGRACPTCCHPLPEGIDTRDPMCVSVIGHSGASKTTTIAAIWSLTNQLGPQSIGMNEFYPTEETANRLRRQVARDYVEKPDGKVESTAGDVMYHPPFEFFASPGLYGESINLLLHDVAGEQLLDRNVRSKVARAVTWSDALIFFYNPETSSHLRKKRSEIEQSVVLNGIRDDIENARAASPPLLMVLSKADLVDKEDASKFSLESEVKIQQAIRNLGDGDVVSAGLRWPEVHWMTISAQPEGGGPVRGVLELMTKVARIIREP